jgi:predicted dehydrogenase
MSIIVRGTGSIGRRHLRVLSECGERAYAMPVRGTDQSMIEGATVIGRYDQAPDARCAVIATDTSRHLSDAREAIDAGLHVLIEKPLSSTADGVDALLDRARETGRRVFVGCNLRFAAGLRRFRDLLPRVGQVYSVRVECQSYLPSWRPTRDHRDSYSARADEGGVMRDLVHEIDYTQWLFGRATAVFADVRNSGELGIQSEESADLLIQTARGVSVSIRLDYLARRPRRSMTAVGSGGELTWDAIAQRVRYADNDAEPELISCEQNRDDTYRAQIQAFLRSVDGAIDDAIASGDDGLAAVRVIDAARESSVFRRECSVEQSNLR